MRGIVGVIAVILVWMSGAGNGASLVVNPSFEDVGPDGKPVGWAVPKELSAGGIITEAPHSGNRAGRIVGDGEFRIWRQEVQAPATRLYAASGWFRAKGLKIDPKAGDDQCARFYFHIHYKGRPYSDTTHVYADIPPGTYDWRRIGLRLVPQTQWPIEKIWVTVACKSAAGTLDFDDITLTVAGFEGGSSAMEWMNGLKPAMITDMARCKPAEALSPVGKRGRWRVIPYEAGDFKGNMVWATRESAAPPLSLPLGVTGWHAVYVGLADPAYVGCSALLRLSGEAAFVPRSRGAGQIEEAFFKVADLTGRSLEIAQQSGGAGCNCGIAYVKMVPLTPEEVAAVQKDRQDPSRRRLATTIDGFSFIYGRRPTTVESLLQETEVYRDSDFDTLVLQMGGADMVNYPSKIGEMCGQNLEVFDRIGDRYYAEAIRELARKGINPTQVLIQGGHDVGMKVHVAIRPAAWLHSEPMSEFFNSRFYQEHPDWRCVDRDGTPVARMSFAVPEVRKHLVEVLREAVRFGADGACILYNRGVPLVLFEKPFCDLFRQRFGVDVMSVQEDDGRVLELRAEVLTTFMKDVRAMLDEEGKARGDRKRLELSAFVLADEADNSQFGLDLRRWTRDKLVDQVFPYLRAGGTKAKSYDMKFLKEACQAQGVRVRPTFVAWSVPDLSAMMRQAVALYDAGADGITMWDGNSGADQTGKWSIVSRLGHVEEIRERADTKPPTPLAMRFHRLGDLITDGRYSPNWGY